MVPAFNKDTGVIALSIAGWDPCGGAGILADHKTFQAHNVYALGAISAITVQNTQAVFSVTATASSLLKEQILHLMDDFPIGAVKIGMLAEESNIQVVIDLTSQWEKIPLVLDPVVLSSSGHALVSQAGLGLLRTRLLPRISVITPNLAEAEWLSGIEIHSKADMERAAKQILDLGVQNVIIKGGHLTGNPDDLLAGREGMIWYPGKRIARRNTHGTGCTFSSALTANLALGLEMTQATKKAKDYVTLTIQEELCLGKGDGIPHHFAPHQS
ncbi:MAG: bifunctional hydroxymethylpyrimidine kinase/phosphomethylpyrimidine kinase [SAR324 cluster bacterium]|uniref:hydroxymethylpyrimidine kinase n=1 Tax=SAR324 cluster bacterium TaxID=2024889 RepID=A0A2A4STE5_9DELT|nr:MAG: bifunctional hydroxymethylpyrimidine kinase/phosphomethylpyrimidine kinase [SAR324 cluster bacterium]